MKKTELVAKMAEEAGLTKVQAEAALNAFVETVKEALAEENETDIVIDGALHRFEFTFELAWKTMKDYLEHMGILEKTGSPREVIQNAFQSNLIENGEDWIEMMLSRNTLSHLYDEEEYKEIYNKIKERYVGMLEKIMKKM